MSTVGEFVLKVEFYALNLTSIMRIDVKGFVQWGCVSDIPLAGMDCVKYPDYYLMGSLILCQGLAISFPSAI